MAQKPSIPKGTRDFSPQEMLRRNYIFDIIRKNFALYGYLPIETPAMESLSTLLGKYGEEGDKLLFRILNSGDFLSGTDRQDVLTANPATLSAMICEKGLRYDLTVPFARYVVQHRDELTFPFRRYQIQPVWRADKPQKGRYREFFQCDVDVIGSNSLLNELELIRIINRVFEELRINHTIRINNRKILSGIAEVAGEKDRITDITIAIDKLDKIGAEGVRKELIQRGIPESSYSRLEPVINLSGTTESKLEQLEKILADSETGLKGVAEMKELYGYLSLQPLSSSVELDLTLARGLNYYTGAIIEVKANDVVIGSICGGGRYDDLTGIFGLPGVSGVGVSFGADRIYDVMLQLGLFPAAMSTGTEVLVINFGKDDLSALLNITDMLRREGISSELYPDAGKLQKQFAYANARSIPWVIVAGSDELENGMVKVKKMATGRQKYVEKELIAKYIKKRRLIITKRNKKVEGGK